MINAFSDLWADTVIRRSLKIFLSIEGLFLIVFGFVWSGLPPQLPLFYSLPRGPEQLANPFIFTLLPIFSFLLMFLNVILSLFFFRNYRLLSRIFILSGTLFVGILFISLLKIIITVT